MTTKPDPSSLESRPFNRRRVMLGVTASIAAYKAADICSRLVKGGADVRVLMTRNATRLVGASTFEGLSHRPAAVDMFAPDDTWEAVLERTSEPADLYIVAPCTADALARIAAGMADDFVSGAALAATCPVLIAPAMASQMWTNPRTRRNVERLRADGLHFVGPEEGRLASGRFGPGRMAEPEAIVYAAARLLTHDDMRGRRVLVTAGPTQEAVDPVRMLTNRSTGKMGIAVAEAAAVRGAEVTLVLGPTHLPVPPGIRTMRVVTAQQMFDAAMEAFANADVVVATAAVSDFRPAAPLEHKAKKGEASLSLALERTPDILAEMGRNRRADMALVGFAAETRDLIGSAREKLRAKNLDMVVANDVTREGAGFGSDDNTATLVTHTETRPLARMSKRALADVILDAVLNLSASARLA